MPSDWWLGREAQSTAYLASNFPCRAACPVGTNAGGYVALIAAGRWREAYTLARAPNPFASVCGRVCAAPCEAACRRGALDEPIQIRALKRAVNEKFGVEADTPFDEIARAVEQPRPRLAEGHRVAVVGAGPAGLACAHDLALMGHKPVVFDAAPVAGGMMRLGIPEYRLPRAQLDREIAFIEWLGVELRLGVEIGRDVTFAELLRDFAAVFLGAGCRRGKGLKIPGAELRGVITAVDLLAKVNLGVPIDVGRRVVVVGGGNVAFDAARSARRLAVDAAVVAARTLKREVTVCALESREEMPADAREIEEGAEEQIRLFNRRGPQAILGQDGAVTALRTIDVARVFDAAGRFAPEFLPGTEQDLACDTVVLAVGQVADLSFLGADHGLATTPQNLVAVDPITLATSRAGVFAGGDVAFGPRIVISAVADGRRAARAIDTHLTGRADEPTRYRLRVFDTFGYDHPFARGDYEKIGRQRLRVLPVEHRTARAEVEQVLSDGDARREGSRCLHCWVNTIFDSSRTNGTECIQCGGCVDVCPEQCIDLASLRRLGGESGAALLKDETACIRCGLCARRCPTGVITMQAFYREDEAPLVHLAEGSL